MHPFVSGALHGQIFRFQFGDDQDDFQRMWGTGVSIPNPLIDIDGAPVYDPRDPTQFYPRIGEMMPKSRQQKRHGSFGELPPYPS